jgi:sulfur carrier protein ThiS
MKILCINNDGAGFADYVEIDEGTTVRSFFDSHIENPDPSNYLIRVNRQPVAQDQVLCEGDRISITPTKIEGAAEAVQ